MTTATIALGTFTVSPLAILAGSLGRTALTGSGKDQAVETAAAPAVGVLAGRPMVAKSAVSRPIGAAAANVIAFPSARPAALVVDTHPALQGLVRTVSA